MGLFDFMKKKAAKKESDQDIFCGEGLVDYIQSNLENPTQENVLQVLDSLAKPDNDLDHLTKDGDLPWGWHTYAKEFTDKIGGEYSHILNTWLESKSKSPKEQYFALKSFVLYLEDVAKLCRTKGECFEFWFYNDLASPEYIQKRKSELEELTANFNKLQADFEKRNKEFSGLDERIIKALIANPGILQSDFVKLFDSLVQNDVREKLYFMEKSGELERKKSGKSYILHYKQ